MNQSSQRDPHVAIVLLNWNGWRDTLECLDTLLRVDFPSFEILLVDNRSDDDSVKKISEWLTRSEGDFPGGRGYQVVPAEAIDSFCTSDEPSFVSLILGTDNGGFSKGNNLALRCAMSRGADYALLLNNDTTVDPGFLGHLVAEAERLRGRAVVAPKMCYYDRPESVWYGGANIKGLGNTAVPTGKHQTSHDVTFVTGAGALVPCSVLEDYGLLDEDFFFGCEDYEFCVRMLKNGVGLRYCADSVVLHKVGSTRRVSAEALYAGYKAQGLYRRKTMAKLPLAAWFVANLAYLATFAPVRQGFARRLGWFASLRASIAGVIDGVKGLPVTEDDLRKR